MIAGLVKRYIAHEAFYLIRRRNREIGSTQIAARRLEGNQLWLDERRENVATLRAAGVMPSLSRPGIRNHNPCSGSLFRMLKYRPAYGLTHIHHFLTNAQERGGLAMRICHGKQKCNGSAHLCRQRYDKPLVCPSVLDGAFAAI
ncbi:hypothetical protein [Paraburkholderia xenovorans]|uniref:hypothetical protein n=1 Tax=Paraburkholderia xenovorans TaxID=36873 RepID=UPI0011D0CB19|nr:hypothetical protein [Paraburkholderia xenovorans]